MIVTMKIEGTLEELAPFFQALQAARSATAVQLELNQQDSANPPDDLVSEEFLRRALERHPLSRNTLALLGALYEAEDEGFLSRESLCEKIGLYTRQEFTDQQLTGVIGSFGKRIHQTEGYDNASYFRYRQTDNGWQYRLPSRFRVVVRDILIEYSFL